MRILALDGSGHEISAALLIDGIVHCVEWQQVRHRHAEHLPPLVARVMAGASFQALDRIAVTLGPGSYTGLRVVLALARGLALASQAELIGVDSFTLWAHRLAEAAPDWHGEGWIALDLRRADRAVRRFAFASGRHPTALDEGRSVLPEEMAERCAFRPSEAVYLGGNGAEAVGFALRESGQMPSYLPVAVGVAPAEILARLAVNMAHGARPEDIRPIYQEQWAQRLG